MSTCVAIDDERMQAILDHWRVKRRGRAMPARDDLDLDALGQGDRRHLVELGVVRENDRTRFYYKDALGPMEALDEPSGVGPAFDEDAPDPLGYRGYVAGLYRELVAVRHPIYNESLFSYEPGRPPLFTRRLVLPLSLDGSEIDAILVAQSFGFVPSSQDYAYSAVVGVKQGVHVVLED